MITAGTKPVDQAGETVARLPAKLRPRPRVDVDAVYRALKRRRPRAA